MPEAAADFRPAVRLPPADDWRTTDQDEINRRRLRAREESPRVVNRDERLSGLLEFRCPFGERGDVFGGNPRPRPAAIQLRLRGLPG